MCGVSSVGMSGTRPCLSGVQEERPFLHLLQGRDVYDNIITKCSLPEAVGLSCTCKGTWGLWQQFTPTWEVLGAWLNKAVREQKDTVRRVLQKGEELLRHGGVTSEDGIRQHLRQVLHLDHHLHYGHPCHVEVLVLYGARLTDEDVLTAVEQEEYTRYRSWMASPELCADLSPNLLAALKGSPQELDLEGVEEQSAWLLLMVALHGPIWGSGSCLSMILDYIEDRRYLPDEELLVTVLEAACQTGNTAFIPDILRHCQGMTLSPEETCSLLLRLVDRRYFGNVSQLAHLTASLITAILELSREPLPLSDIMAVLQVVTTGWLPAEPPVLCLLRYRDMIKEVPDKLLEQLLDKALMKSWEDVWDMGMSELSRRQFDKDQLLPYITRAMEEGREVLVFKMLHLTGIEDMVSAEVRAEWMERAISKGWAKVGGHLALR